MSYSVEKASELVNDNYTYIIYSNPGVGKTYSLGFIEGKTLVIDIDGSSTTLKNHPNAENIDVLKVDSSNIFDDWMQLVKHLVLNKEEYAKKYDTIAVDNISELFRSSLADLGSRGTNKGVPNQGDYQTTDFMLLRSLRAFNNLGVRVVFTAWESTDQYASPTGQSFTRSMPDVRPKILNNFLGLVDVAGRLVIKEDADGNKVRGFVLQPTNSVFAKNRVDDRVGCKVEDLIVSKEVNK